MDKRYVDRIMNTNIGSIGHYTCPYCGGSDLRGLSSEGRPIYRGRSVTCWKCITCDKKFRKVWKAGSNRVERLESDG